MRRFTIVALTVLIGALSFYPDQTQAEAKHATKFVRFQVGEHISYGIVEGSQVRQISGDLFGPCTAGGVLEVAKHHSQINVYMVCDDIRYITHPYGHVRDRALEKNSAEHHASYRGWMYPPWGPTRGANSPDSCVSGPDLSRLKI